MCGFSDERGSEVKCCICIRRNCMRRRKKLEATIERLDVEVAALEAVS